MSEYKPVLKGFVFFFGGGGGVVCLFAFFNEIT